LSDPSKIGVILGSGLGSFAHTLEKRKETPYSDIPGWPVSTAIGHAGKLVTGWLGDTELIVAAGRAHLYEGYTAQQVAYPIREMMYRGMR
jgi:purine-nucleoside phosphorylase